MLRIALLCLVTLLLAVPAQAQQNPALHQALSTARHNFELAAPALGRATLGVNTAAYADALKHSRFQSPAGSTGINFVIQDKTSGDCARFAAYVAPVSGEAAAYIFICPRFFSTGTDLLRQTTILHELVHVVAGPDECLAMAYTAHIQHLATGTYQPVGPYWDRSGCGTSRYSLPR